VAKRADSPGGGSRPGEADSTRGQPGSAGPSAKTRRPRPLPTEESLKEAALAYALRFPGTTERLRTHLHKKVNEAMQAGVAPSHAWRWIEPVIETLTRVRVLDDSTWAEHRAQSLHRRGRSSRVIARDLVHKHTSPPSVEHALTALSESGATDWLAAVTLAKKKRLGPFGPSVAADREAQMKLRAKQLGTLARAGFSFEIARRIVDAKTREALEQT
jgi:regulatory protein